MAWCSDCLCMFCCGPCALERRYGSNKNCGCTLSPWTIFHVLCTDASALLSYGYWISRNKEKPSQVSCSDLCCVPCLYASERQQHLQKLDGKQEDGVEMTDYDKNENNENNENNEKQYPVTDQPQTKLLLKL